MEANLRLRLAPLGEPSDRCRGAVVDRQIETPVRKTILRLRQLLLDRQRPEGSWAPSPEATPRSIAERYLCLAYIGKGDSEAAKSLVTAIRAHELPSGGWSRNRGGLFDLTTSVLGYLALKLADGAAGLRELRSSRRAILCSGGAQQADGAALAWLALFSQLPKTLSDCLPEATVEVIKAAGRVPISPLNGVAELFSPADDLTNASAQANPKVHPLWLRLTEITGCESKVDAEQKREELESWLLHGAVDGREGASPQATATALGAVLDSGFRRGDRPVATAVAQLVGATKRLDPETDALATAAMLSAFARWLESGHPADDRLPPRLSAFAGTDEKQPYDCELTPDALIAAGKELTERLVSSQCGGRWLLPHTTDTQAVTAMVEALSSWRRAARLQGTELRPVQQAVDCGVGILLQSQAADGSWPSSEPAMQNSATAGAIHALLRAGAGSSDAAIELAANWLLAEQRDTGAWAVSPLAGDTEAAGDLEVTACVVSALVAAGFGSHPSVLEAIDWIVAPADDDGRHGVGHTHAAITAALAALSKWAVAAPIRNVAAPRICLRLVSEDTLHTEAACASSA